MGAGSLSSSCALLPKWDHAGGAENLGLVSKGNMAGDQETLGSILGLRGS